MVCHELAFDGARYLSLTQTLALGWVGTWGAGRANTSPALARGLGDRAQETKGAPEEQGHKVVLCLVISSLGSQPKHQLTCRDLTLAAELGLLPVQ